MRIERNNHAALDQSAYPYVHAVKYNGLLFLSGVPAFVRPTQGKAPSSQLAPFSNKLAASPQPKTALWNRC